MMQEAQNHQYLEEIENEEAIDASGGAVVGGGDGRQRAAAMTTRFKSDDPDVLTGIKAGCGARPRRSGMRLRSCLVNRSARWKTIAGILAAWVTTLPVAAAISIGVFMIVQ